MLDEEEDIIMVVDEEGNERECVVLTMSRIEGEVFVLLGRLDQLNSDSEDLELCILQAILDENGEQVYAGVEDEDKHLHLQEVFSEFLDSWMEGADDDDVSTQPVAEA